MYIVCPNSLCSDSVTCNGYCLYWVLAAQGLDCGKVTVQKHNQQQQKKNQRKPQNHNSEVEMDVLFRFFHDTFSADYLYTMVCLISSD